RTGLFRHRNGGTRGWRPTIRLDQRVPRWAREEAQMPIASAVAGRHVALDPLAPGVVLLGRLGSRDWLFVERASPDVQQDDASLRKNSRHGRQRQELAPPQEDAVPA